jgi:hypothetical protein
MALLVKLDHGDAGGLGFGTEWTGAEEAVHRHLVSGGTLRQGQIYGEALQAAHFESFDYLNDAHARSIIARA